MIDQTPLIPLIPFVSFILILLAGVLPRKKGIGGLLSWLVGTIATLLSLILSVVILIRIQGNEIQQVAKYIWTTGGVAPDLVFGILIDPLSSLTLVIVSIVAFLVHVFSKAYMNEENESGLPRYYAGLSLFTGSMLFFVVSSNLLTSFVFFELVGFCSWWLINFWFSTPEAASAAKKAFLVTRFGDYFFLVGLVASFAAFGTLNFVGENSIFTIAETAINQGENTLGFSSETGILLISLLILGGVIGKSAQFPLHTWLPEAMEGPTPVSALIHAATMVAAGVYLVARLFPLYHLSPNALLIIAFIGGFTALISATMGIVMDDIKRVLAYSTISQYGYMMLALGAGGYTAAVFHLMNHAFFKALLFLGAGSVIIATHHTMDMWKHGGLKKSMPITYYTFLVGSLALAGIIPFSGFWSKDEVLAYVFNQAITSEPLMWIPFLMGLVAVVFTGFYTFRMVALTFHGESRSEHSENANENSIYAIIPLVLLGILAIVSGFVNAAPIGIHTLGDFLTSGHGDSVVNLGVTGISLLLALIGSIAGFILYKDNPTKRKENWGVITKILENRYYINSFQIGLSWNFLKFSDWVDLFDIDVVDGIVNAISKVSFGSGDAMRRVQTGKVTQYAALIIFSFIALIIITGFIGGWL